MLPGQIPYRFKALPWQYKGPAAWCFVSLPVELSSEIRLHAGALEQGWGRLPVKAAIGGVEWKTAIWFDTKQNTYILPLKSAIRKQLHIDMDTKLDVVVYL